MQPGLKRLPRMLLMLSCLAMPAISDAYAQNNSIAPIPSDADLQNTNNPYAAPLAPQAPRIEPMRNPQDQAAYMSRQAEAQQIAGQQARMAAQAQGGTTQYPIQAQRAVAPIAQPMIAQPMQQQLQPIEPQMIPSGQTPETAQAQTGTAQPISTTTTATSSTEEAAPTTPSVTPGATQQGTATTTTGFAPQNSDNSLPLNRGGLMPLASTNPGMNMNIDPNLVGGMDAYGNPTGGESAVPVPYEVQLEQRTQEIQTRARDMAYDQAKKSVLPMETYEIRDVLGRLKDTQEAIQTPARPAPKPGNVIETISTDPSATPKTIQLAAGNVTTLNIVDITGEPWPIVDLGFGGAFDVKPPEAGGHVIRITPLKDFARGNLVVRLLKMTTPITFSLQSGGDSVNYRFDARIPDYGPNAKMPIIGGGISTVAGDKTTTAFLEGVPPKGSVKLAVEGMDGRTNAYKFGGALYLRTPLALISPAWQGSATSADGMNVYVLNDAPVLLLSDKGALVRARISDAKKEATGF